MASCKYINNFTPVPSDNFFFDNNVWIFLFCPIGNHDKNKQKRYSCFLQQIMSSKATIWVNGVVLSEFINTSLRLDFNLWKQNANIVSPDFKKDYRQTIRYKSTIQSIISAVTQILKISEKCTDNFNALDLNNIFNNLFNIDFNDLCYVELCKCTKYKLVTDDHDFDNIKDNITVIH